MAPDAGIKLSILYLRCEVPVWRVAEVAKELAFNSLFEMRCVNRVVRAEARTAAFNSLFEMRNPAPGRTVGQDPKLSILYLRCRRICRLCGTIYGLYTFQFSI